MVLHTLVGISPDVLDLSVRDVVLPVVPMFHVNAWGLAYGAPAVGTKLVFPGPRMGDGETLQALIEEEQVTFSAGSAYGMAGPAEVSFRVRQTG